MRLLKKILIAFLLFMAVGWVYVEVANINAVNMTTRQKILKAIYPLIMWAGKGKTLLTAEASVVDAPVSLYALKTTLIDSTELDLSTLKGKKILFVNTASDCGFTGQYEALQLLHEKYSKDLVVIGFPANDFKEQEKGSNADIAAFCKKNYGVNFLLASKSSVVKSADQHPVFKWLSSLDQNGWNDQAPTWNFCKYLVDTQGRLIGFFDSSVDPMDTTLIQKIESK